MISFIAGTVICAVGVSMIFRGIDNLVFMARVQGVADGYALASKEWHDTIALKEELDAL